jgi:hypothetical protein
VKTRKIKYRALKALRHRIRIRRDWDYTLREWGAAPPVGHEFGSPDFERLAREAFTQGRDLGK